VNNSGRTIKLHTENNHLCQVITTFSTGLTALNGLTAQVQNFATGTTGTDFAISSATSTHTFNLPTASAANRGALSSADWSTFNSKVPSTRSLTINGTTQDLSADRTFTIATGLTVGTTPITSGTVGRVLFEGTGNVLQQSGSLFWDNTNSRLGIGTASPATTFDVNGTARFKGASNVGTTTALTVVNSDSTTLLQVQDNGYIRIGSQTTSAFRIYSTDASGDAEPSGLNLVLNSRVVSSATAAGIGMVMLNGINGTSTTGTQIVFLISKGFAPTSGTGTYAASSIIPTINQTGGANGITRGLYINPTLTAAADFRAIETTVGKVCLNTTSGNTMIGTTTDAGFKLDVNGTTRLNGLSSINGVGVANTALAVYGNGNGGGNYLFRMYDASAVERFYLTASGNFRLNGATDTSTTGTDEKWRMVLNFAPTSGTREHNGIYLTQTINQTGGANGISRGLLIQPTLTAAADYRAIEVTAGTTVLAPSVTARASLRIPSGTAPTSPVNGDIWFDGTDIKMRIGGVTKTFTLI
jgi:hypothetical protein